MSDDIVWMKSCDWCFAPIAIGIIIRDPSSGETRATVCAQCAATTFKRATITIPADENG